MMHEENASACICMRTSLMHAFTHYTHVGGGFDWCDKLSRQKKFQNQLRALRTDKMREGCMGVYTVRLIEKA